MALRQRNVTGTLVSGDGLPVNAGKIRFKLKSSLGYTSTHVIIDRLFEATTASDGTFLIALWCDEDSLVAIDYQVLFAVADSGAADSQHAADISLSYQDGTPKPIGTLIAESTPASGIVSDVSLAGLMDSRIAVRGESLTIACSDESTSLTTGTAKATFRMPFPMILTAVRLNVNTAPTGAPIIIDVKEGGSTIFSTKPQIAASAKTSVGGAVPGVISDTSLADDAEITVNIDQVGSTIAGKGLKVTFVGTRS